MPGNQDPIHPEEQPQAASRRKLELFTQACDLLGGNKAAAAALGMSDRSLRYLFDGTRPLHRGLLEDISKALLAHADQCRALERQLSPAFAENAAGLPEPHGHSAHARRIHTANQDLAGMREANAAISPGDLNRSTELERDINDIAREFRSATEQRCIDLYKLHASRSIPMRNRMERIFNQRFNRKPV